MPSVLEPERQLPVRYDVDVIVVGGGPGGIRAAIGAARNGAKTLLVERFGCLGGSQTLTYSSSFSFVNSELHGGFVKEITERMDKGGG
ncbi:MAG: FAD-dependent oxidoreductase, partial [Betaproteobacteria bacterium]|nr:FAD-dependent oxidoreductase [Betaproteobacteria bacterium]